MKPLSQSHVQPWSFFTKYNTFKLFGVLLMVVSLEVTESSFLIKTLPGLLGDLPSTFETGYIGVGESDDVQLFYYFVESQGNPETDPLMLWLSGGPGCSVLSSAMYIIGPFSFNYANSTLEKQMLEINPYSWTKAANIIFLDQPAGSGFSYSKTPEAYITNDTLATMHAYLFLKKWLMDHPRFLNNPLYVGADSYSGIIAPMIVQEIYDGNEAGERPHINIKGYVLGNPGTDTIGEFNSRIQYANNMALLSDAIYKSTKENCHGEYFNVDPNNTLCINDLKVVDKCLGRIYVLNILEPVCDTLKTIKYDELFRRALRSSDDASLHIWSLPQVLEQACRRAVNDLYITAWANNNREVQEALHVREVFHTIPWVTCNESLKFYIDKKPISYTHNIMSTVAYHRYLAHKKCRALVYSGDHDMFVPYLSTLNWIESLKLLQVENWRPWFFEEQVLGYTMKYSNHHYNLTFATVKGGGHIPTEYKPEGCLNMFTRWLANEAL